LAALVDGAALLPAVLSHQVETEEAMTIMLAALISCTLLAIVAFVVGYFFGSESGRQDARQAAHDQCLDFARLALHGAAPWRSMTPAAALRMAGVEILRPGTGLFRKIDQRRPFRANRVIREGTTGAPQ
jgi:hypothetical protein